MSSLFFITACDTNTVENTVVPFYMDLYSEEREFLKTGKKNFKKYFFSMIFKYKLPHRVGQSL